MSQGSQLEIERGTEFGTETLEIVTGKQMHNQIEEE